MRSNWSSKGAKSLLLVVAIALTHGVATAQGSPYEVLTTDQLAKTHKAIMDRAEAGQPQRLFINLEQTEILSRERDRHRALNAQIGMSSTNEQSTLQLHEAINSDTRREVAALLKEVLPDYLHGRNVTVKAFSNFASAIVDIPDASTLAKILAHAKVVGVHADPIGRLTGSNNLSLIGQTSAASAGYVGAGTRVAMLDTAFDFSQPEFATDNTYPACKFDYMNGNANSNVGGSRCRLSNALNFADSGQAWCEGGPGCNVLNAFHGELDAGIILAVAPSTKIAALQIFDVNGNSYGSYSAAALDWVASNANNQPKIAAVNISVSYSTPMGVCANNALSNAFAAVINKGVAIVGSAGNSASLTGLELPACDPGVVAVGEVYDTADSRQQSYAFCTDASAVVDRVACQTNSTSKIALWAPGVKITVNGITATGTSQAAPHVSGAIAVLRGSNAYPSESGSASVARLTSTGKQVTDSRNGVVKPRVQLDAALGLTATSIVISPPNPVIPKRLQYTMTASVINGRGDTMTNVPIVWTSDDPSVAIVGSSTGIVRGISEGTATIYATGGGKSASTVVTVTSGVEGNPPSPPCPGPLCS